MSLAKPVTRTEESNIKMYLKYDPDTGSIHHKNKRGKAGSNCNGYIKISVQYKTFYAHRLAWFLHYDKWPVGEVDHINDNKSDNRICNLRDVSISANRRKWNKMDHS